MSNFAKLEFAALDISSKNYLSWVLDAEIHLDAKGLGNTILANKEASNQDKAKIIIFIHHHLHEGLKVEYLIVKDPLELWKKLKEQFDHQNTMHLRLQDFKTVSEYNLELFEINSQLKLCGENITDEVLLKKTFSTFHATTMFLQQQYREKVHPTGSASFPKVNVAVHNNYENRKYRGRNRGRGRSGGRGQGRTSNRFHSGHNNYTSNHQKKNNNERQEKSGQNNPSNIVENICYRCGMKGQ
ncbi:hypothetical protein V6Z12_D03G123800 [Gossypium hirsutum]